MTFVIFLFFKNVCTSDNNSCKKKNQVAINVRAFIFHVVEFLSDNKHFFYSDLIHHTF